VKVEEEYLLNELKVSKTTAYNGDTQIITYRGTEYENIIYFYNDGDFTYCVDKNRRRHSVCQYYSVDGSCAFEDFIDGGRHGWSYVWHSNGVLAEKVQYRDNKKQGRYKTWYGNGQLYQDATYVDDVAKYYKCYDRQDN
jgi:antitoxin component YwqK of YwqJK toxin-antitoxin module